MNITTEPLTREHIRELRKADRVSFTHSQSGHRIRVTRPVSQGSQDEISIEIPVDSVVNGMTGVENAEEFRKNCNCHLLLWANCGFHSRQWGTVAELLKPGDHIILHWGRDYHTNENTRKADLHADRLELQVVRRDRRKYSFLIEVQICPDNTARMIRNGPFNMG